MRVVWSVVVSLALAGCSAPVPESGDGEDVVLLAHIRPGMGKSRELFDPPDFALYGDGRAVVRERRDDDVMRLVEYRLTPQRVQSLFEEADDAELFDDEDYALHGEVLDAGSLVIMLRTREREHLVRVVHPDPDDFGVRGDAAEFAASLDPASWAESDFTEPPKPYRPGRVAVIYAETSPAEDEDTAAWPLETGPIEEGCAVLTGRAATRVQELGESTPRMTWWRHDDVAFHAWVRPLLPDEADCQASQQRYLR